MRYSTSISKVVGVVALGAALAVLSACASGVSQSDYDAAKKQAADEQLKAQQYQQQLSAKVQEATTLQKQVSDKDAALAAAQKQVADLQKQGGTTKAGLTTLFSAKAVPTPTPRPTPTPPPPGFTPPPPVTVPPDVANEVVPFTFYVETLATSSVSQYGLASFIGEDKLTCNPNSVFKRGTKLVWRYEVFDTKTGKRLTDLDGATVKVKLPNGTDLTSRYSRRAGEGPWMWASGWDIPLDYPLGSFDYALSVTTKDGRSYTWKAPALIKKDGTEDSRIQIIS